MAKYQPPANLDDFDKSASKRDQLFDAWHVKIDSDVKRSLGSFPAFFEGINPPANVDAVHAKPSWPGLPGAARRLFTGTLAAIAAKIDGPVRHGDPDPLLETSTPFVDPTDLSSFDEVWYRPHDEYLEWAVVRDAGGGLREVFFTSEGPEYWRAMASVDMDLVVDLYRRLTGVGTITRADLEFPKAVTQVVRRGAQLARREDFAKGQYNPYNRFNRDFAIHLTQRANTLGAEIQLAKDASRLYGNPVKTTDPALVCCAGYGEPNRNSDPTIGAVVNAAVRDAKKRVSLVDPVGLYVRDWRWDQITCDDKPFPDAVKLFEVVRGDAAAQRVLRLHFRIPAGLQFDGTPVTMARLKIGAEPITTGGQIASLINVHLFAMTAPGAPQQAPVACSGKPCFAKGHPQFIVTIDPGDTCPQTGIDLGLPTPPLAGGGFAAPASGGGALDAVPHEGPVTRARRR